MTMEWAAEAGKLEVVEYLHRNGCPWGEGACKQAAERGRVDVLRYLRACNGSSDSASGAAYRAS